MAFAMPKIPEGTGAHPIPMVTVSADDLAASSAFYAKVFGWEVHPLSAELAAVAAPAGPAVTLRANTPEGFPGVIPFVGVPDVDEALVRVVVAGGSVEKAAWNAPMVGKLARFTAPSGGIYGLTSVTAPSGVPRMPMPIGTNPKPPAGAVCHLEMYASDRAANARFFGEVFGWGSIETMPQYTAFDPGVGVGGIFQSHTPATPAVAYLYVEDVAGTLAAIEAAGGRRQGQPMKMPGVATFGYFRDPSGTSLGLIGP